MLSDAELRRIAEDVAGRGAYLLVDETYRDLTVSTPRPFATTLSNRVISVASLSKAYGLPGLRVGSHDSRDATLKDETFLAAKEQMSDLRPRCFDEEDRGTGFYARRTEELPPHLGGRGAAGPGHAHCVDGAASQPWSGFRRPVGWWRFRAFAPTPGFDVPRCSSETS